MKCLRGRYTHALTEHAPVSLFFQDCRCSLQLQPCHACQGPESFPPFRGGAIKAYGEHNSSRRWEKRRPGEERRGKFDMGRHEVVQGKGELSRVAAEAYSCGHGPGGSKAGGGSGWGEKEEGGRKSSGGCWV